MKLRSYVLPVALLVFALFVSACGSAATTSAPAATNPPAVATNPPAEPTATTAVAAEPTTPPASSAPDGKALVEERCTACHALSRVENEDGTAEDWKAIVEGMVQKGAVLNADEQAIVIAYLAATYPK